jgi:phosphoglycerate kinase
MQIEGLDPRLRVIQQADMKGKVVLVRVDHNVVKKGTVQDPYRIDASWWTLYAIAEKGGRPILMTHIGRPKDKKTGRITCDAGQSVAPIVHYLGRKLPVEIHVPEFSIDPDKGILHLDETVRPAVEALRSGKVGMIYLPNTRWFQGEQSGGPERETFAKELAALADLYVNNAFGSWQAHASTYDIAMQLPAYAGILLQKEIGNLHRVLEPEKPFVGVIAGSKYDTKIGPLKSLYAKVDHLILGGLMYNTFVSAKYGIPIAGVSEEDRGLAAELVEMDSREGKILELPYLVESDTLEGSVEGKHRVLETGDFRGKEKLNYILDASPRSFEDPKVKEVIASANTILVNAVMGLMPHFPDGSRALYQLVTSNASAWKLFGGGDTLQELRNLCPACYLAGLDDPKTYYFTGGGSVLGAIEQGSPYKLKPVEVLMAG